AMNTPEITVKRREGTGKGVARRLRRAGAVPAILYGGATPQTITVNPRDVLRIIHGHEGTTQLLSLKVEGDGGARMAIIRDMQFDPVTEKLVHVDIQEVRADRAITVRVAVHPVGEAVGVRDTKGILNLVMHEVEVSTLPTNIPERIDADVSNLAIGDVLTVRDLRPPEGARLVAWRHPLPRQAPVVHERERTERAARAARARGGPRGPGARLRRHRHGARQGPHAPAGQRGRPQRRAVGDRRARHRGDPPREDRHRPAAAEVAGAGPRAHDLRAGG